MRALRRGMVGVCVGRSEEKGDRGASCDLGRSHTERDGVLINYAVLLTERSISAVFIPP
jgi:hypothetical protein